MRAISIDGYGIANVAPRIVPDPEPGPHDVVVGVKAAALNHLDLWTLSGSLGIPHQFPHVLGADAAGEIHAVGSEIERLRPGMRVVVNPALSCRECEFCRAGEHSLCTRFQMLGEHHHGTLAELVRVPATNVFPFPEEMSFADGAALGVTFITAYRMLFDRGRLHPGEWIAITGIGGGLALSLFQLARPLAGKIFVTSSSDAKLERATEMGATGTVNYEREDVGRALRGMTGKRGVDAVFDSAGGSSLEAATRAVRKGGRVVVAGATAGGSTEIDVRRLFWNQLEIIGSTMGSDANISDMLRYVSGQDIRPLIDRTFPLDDAADALRYLESNAQFGKIVIAVSA